MSKFERQMRRRGKKKPPRRWVDRRARWLRADVDRLAGDIDAAVGEVRAMSHELGKGA